MTTLYTAAQVAKEIIPDASEFTLDHVAGAIENLTIWSLDHGRQPKHDRADVIKEVREMNMAMESRDAIVCKLEQTQFFCEWMLSQFDSDAAGFSLN